MNEMPPHERDDAPVVTSPALAVLVERARAQTLPPLRTTAASVRAAAMHRRQRRTMWTGVGLLAAAAIVLAIGLRGRLLDREEVERRDAAAMASEPPAPATVETREPASATARSIAPAPVEPAPESTVPESPAPIVAPPPDIVPAPRTERPGAAELARQAERAMAEHRRGDAIAALTQLVRLHGHTATGRTGLLDLARLLRDAGRRDEARCAYRSWIERWPGDDMRGDVDRALAALGEGPSCRGLRPRR